VSNLIKMERQKHRRIQKKFLFYLDGDLPEKEKQEVDIHLSGCPDCSTHLARLSSAWKPGKAERFEPSPFLWARLERRLGEDEGKKSLPPLIMSHGQRLWRPALGFIGLSLAFAIGIYVGTPSPSLRPSPEQALSQPLDLATELGLSQFDLLPPNSLPAEFVPLNQRE